jgi:methylamine methyltransferase corrinoid protein reductive activase
MTAIGIALDLGTSGFRGQALDLSKDGQILSTAVTTRHPLPGANVMDHLHFAVEMGLKAAQAIVITAVNRVIDHLKVPHHDIARLAVCGNPIQLSLFEGIEIRDLAYAGENKQKALGIVPPKRDAHILKAHHISGLNVPENADVLIPPAVRHEIGADALAMMIQTGMLEKDDIAITTDYGTNAEMALIVNGTVFTGSTAAGPALEGQHIEDGLLALPGAICDMTLEPEESPVSKDVKSQFAARQKLRTFVLDGEMTAQPGDTVDSADGTTLSQGQLKAVGITGTGVIALISEHIKYQVIRLPKILHSDALIHLPNGKKFTEKDLEESGKAIGAIRAGHIALCDAAGIKLEDIQTAYMSGASGTYVDALKAQRIGMIPPGVDTIFQVGNASLAMARDMVQDEDELWRMRHIANDLRQHHCMFAQSKVFEKVYILELSYWTQGMPMDQYQRFLKKFSLPPLTTSEKTPQIIKTVNRDIPDLGVRGMDILSDIGEQRSILFERCTGCEACADACPEHALKLDGETLWITIDLARCNGLACRRCEKACPEQVFSQKALYTAAKTEPK